MCIWLILPAQSMGKLAKSQENSIWYASKILNGTLSKIGKYLERRGGGGGYSLTDVHQEVL